MLNAKRLLIIIEPQKSYSLKELAEAEINKNTNQCFSFSASVRER